MCRVFGDDAIDRRDHAIILVGFASGLRRSDMARLRTEHVHLNEDPKRMRLWVPISKTDQEGRGRDVWIDRGELEYTCPVRILQQWLKVRGSWAGPVFARFTHLRVMTQDGLGEQGICSALKRALERVGENSADYGAHSLRSGMITTAYSTCKNVRDIMDRTGHTNVESVMRYVKSSPRSTANPLAGVL
jgi:integrase